MKMNNAIWLPSFTKSDIASDSQFLKSLDVWLAETLEEFETGTAASSQVMAAFLASEELSKKSSFDWVGFIEEHLMLDGKPLAYTSSFGRKLHKFDDQWQQFNLNSAYNCWFIFGRLGQDARLFESFVETKRQPNGLYFDGDTSPTTFRHRMKSEVAMSTAMACEILNSSGRLSENQKNMTLAALVDPGTMPIFNYLSYEYFRCRAVNELNPALIDESRIAALLARCATETVFGWSDFVMAEKTNDYMGTATRVSRDKNINSPLLATMAAWLLEHADQETMSDGKGRLKKYSTYLKRASPEIPAFKMRDLPYDFGSSATGLELLAAQRLINI